MTLLAGRPMATKRRLYEQVTRRLEALGTGSADILVVLNEQPMENWAVDGPVPASEVDVGFKVDI